MLHIYQSFLPAKGLRRILIFRLSMSAALVFTSILSCACNRSKRSQFELTGRADSLHTSWAPIGILMSNIFEVIGGGDVIRIVACATCVADIVPPEHL